MYIKYWGEFEEGDGAIGGDGTFNFKELTTKLCQPDDFNNLEGSNEKSRFFKTDPESLNDLNTYGPKMRCLDEDKYQIFGNYDAKLANNLMIVFEKCDRD